jgi:hypothetical protein
MGQPTRYRQPWAPAVPSTLGMSSSAVLPVVQATMPGGIKVEHEGTSDQGADLKTNPATPVKAEDNSVSPGRGSTHNE